ncbi:FG-GAP repeat protein [Leptospira bandrabouensis]|uniref:FG-GAP repeat protein n=1 Tax=Leptospira bandrabouensis TaxID=2484903 RepID=UPI001EEB0C51|nr:FG-GAP repeat protein [Leptospira bandrabouensis]MCG6152131.1 FG-GAP repeat protein [Leptospira bandrabouensis]
MSKGQIGFPSFLIEMIVGLFLLLVCANCQRLTLNNPCDQKSKGYRETLLLASISGTPIPFCGFRVSNSPKLWEATQAYLKASDAGDLCGNSVAITGDTIVVGASGESSFQTRITNGPTVSTINSALSSGAAFVFFKK